MCRDVLCCHRLVRHGLAELETFVVCLVDVECGVIAVLFANFALDVEGEGGAAIVSGAMIVAKFVADAFVILLDEAECEAMQFVFENAGAAATLVEVVGPCCCGQGRDENLCAPHAHGVCFVVSGCHKYVEPAIGAPGMLLVLR